MTPMAANAFQLARIVSFEGSVDISVAVDILRSAIKSGGGVLIYTGFSGSRPKVAAWQVQV